MRRQNGEPETCAIAHPAHNFVDNIEATCTARCQTLRDSVKLSNVGCALHRRAAAMSSCARQRTLTAESIRMNNNKNHNNMLTCHKCVNAYCGVHSATNRECTINYITLVDENILAGVRCVFANLVYACRMVGCTSHYSEHSTRRWMCTKYSPYGNICTFFYHVLCSKQPHQA